MTLPRCVLPNETYLLTRRCSERRFFMKPSPTVNEVLRHALATRSKRHGIRLHSFVFLSNHYHIVFTDPQARAPDFVRDLNSLIARCLNAELGRKEYFWDSSRPSLVRLIDPDDVIEKMTYTLANPVAAGLVAEGRDWPGLRSRPRDLTRTPVVTKTTSGLLGENSRVPSSAVLELSKPDQFDELSDCAFVELLQDRVVDSEQRLREQRVEGGGTFLGPDAVLAQEPEGRPRTKEEDDQEIDPKIACRNPEKRKAVLLELKNFLRTYREAFQEFRSGLRETVFPPGTWWLRVRAGVACAASP